MKRFLIPAILIAVSIAVYLPALNYDFVYDDPRQIEMMSSRFTWSHVPSYFTTDVWSYINQRKSNYYRPIFLVWMLLTHELAGLDHAAWHASAILTNALAVLLLYFLARKLAGNEITAAIAALLFAVHPVHIESVAWVSGATEPLWAIFFFATLLLFISARVEPDGDRARRFRIGAAACFAIAIFSKETAIVTPVLIFLYVCLFPEPSAKSRIKAALSTALPYLQIIAVYIAARLYVLRALSPNGDRWSVKLTLSTLPEMIAFYCKELVWPFHLAVFPPLAQVHELRIDNFLIPAGIALAVIALLVWAAWRSRTAAFAVAMLALTIGPVLWVRAFWRFDFVHDRYLYVPSAGFCILLALGIAHLASSWRPAWILATVSPLVALLAFFTIRQSEPWRDQLTFAQFALGMAPASLPAEEQLMTAYIQQERYSEALPLAEHAAEADPLNGGMHVAAGICHLKLQHWGLAAEQFKSAIKLLPPNAQEFLCLGMAELELGDVAEAETHMRHAIDLRVPGSVQYRGYRFYLGDLLERKGDQQAALTEYNRELEEYPDDDMTAQRAAELKLKMGR